MSDFNNRITTFESSVNSKIDSQVTSYLDKNGIWSGKEQVKAFLGKKEFVDNDDTKDTVLAKLWSKRNVTFSINGINVDSIKLCDKTNKTGMLYVKLYWTFQGSFPDKEWAVQTGGSRQFGLNMLEYIDTVETGTMSKEGFGSQLVYSSCGKNAFVDSNSIWFVIGPFAGAHTFTGFVNSGKSIYWKLWHIISCTEDALRFVIRAGCEGVAFINTMGFEISEMKIY